MEMAEAKTQKKKEKPERKIKQKWKKQKKKKRKKTIAERWYHAATTTFHVHNRMH